MKKLTKDEINNYINIIDDHINNNNIQYNKDNKK